MNCLEGKPINSIISKFLNFISINILKEKDDLVIYSYSLLADDIIAHMHDSASNSFDSKEHDNKKYENYSSKKTWL